MPPVTIGALLVEPSRRSLRRYAKPGNTQQAIFRVSPRVPPVLRALVWYAAKAA